jgi:hypothetical protein
VRWQRQTAVRRLMLIMTIPMMACHTWIANPLNSQLTTATFPSRIRVTVASGVSLLLDSARVANDTLVGYRHTAPGGAVDSSVRLNVRDVVTIEKQRLSASRTVGVVAITVVSTALVAAAAFFIMLASWTWEE